MSEARPANQPNRRRELQARREVGRTEISRATAACLSGLFLATLAVVPMSWPWMAAEAPTAGSPAAPVAAVAAASDAPSVPRLLAANRRLIAGLRALEDRLEEGSWPRRRLLPRLQEVLTGRLGMGNEQAYAGRDGWLYYRPDVEHLTGPGFLEAEVLSRRRRGGAAWRPAPQPDPVIALLDFARQVRQAGAMLVVLPTPVKPALVPGPLGGGRRPEPPLRNRSFGELVERLEAVGIRVVDPAPRLAALGEEGYLRADTHWRPEGVAVAAGALAAVIDPFLESAPRLRLRRRPVAVEGVGDTAAMLRLPAGQQLFPPQRVIAQMVLDGAGRPWRPDPEAQVLLLGDSFTNVYSDPALGWGRAAGLAEQLAYELARPVDRVALNAGGARATREALARSLASGRTRLEGKRVVVYQFANRELSSGDWRLVDLASSSHRTSTATP